MYSDTTCLPSEWGVYIAIRINEWTNEYSSVLWIDRLFEPLFFFWSHAFKGEGQAADTDSSCRPQVHFNAYLFINDTEVFVCKGLYVQGALILTTWGQAWPGHSVLKNA